MKKEDIYNAVSGIRPEYLDEADNYKPENNTGASADEKDDQVNSSKQAERTVTEEYRIEAETHSGRKYAGMIASAAAVLLIAGTAGLAASIGINRSSDTLSSEVVSESQTVSPETVAAVSEKSGVVTENTAVTTLCESTDLTGMTVTEASVTAAESSEQKVSEEIRESKKTENEIRDNTIPVVTEIHTEPVTLKAEINVAEVQTEPEIQQTEPKVSQIHLPAIPYDPSENYLSDEAITPENFTKLLESLSYSPETCDGLPEYRYTSADGTEYYILLSCRHVWRSKAGSPMEEAELSDYSLAMIRAFIGLYGLEECMWD